MNNLKRDMGVFIISTYSKHEVGIPLQTNRVSKATFFASQTNEWPSPILSLLSLYFWDNKTFPNTVTPPQPQLKNKVK